MLKHPSRDSTSPLSNLHFSACVRVCARARVCVGARAQRRVRECDVGISVNLMIVMKIRHRWMCFPCQSVCWPQHVIAHTAGLVRADYLLQSMWAMDCTWGSPPLCLLRFPVNCLFSALQNNCVLVPLSAWRRIYSFSTWRDSISCILFLLRAWVSPIKYVNQ